VQVTRNGGATWTNVRANLPGMTGEVWVSRVEPSHHDPATAYVVLDNHRRDDMNPHVFMTRDFGATFRDITGNLPDGIGSYVVNEDPVNPNLLFVGTEFGVYASIEGGGRWFKLSTGLPDVAVRDLLIHPRDGDLVAGTHGRSIWILDDISPLRQMAADVMASAMRVLDNRVATRWASIDLGRQQPDFVFRGENPAAGAAIHFWLRDAPGAGVSLDVSEFAGDRVARVPLTGGRGSSGVHAGLNRVRWNMDFPSTTADRAAMQARLVAAITFLDGRVVDATKREQLSRLRTQIALADTDRTLNTIRNELAADFNGYAVGRTLFGPQIGATRATPGTYRVTLTVGGASHVGSITIRQDPLMTEHGRR
jgi:hypothetical protein